MFISAQSIRESTHFSGKTFHKIVTPGCRDLLKMDTDVGNKVLTCDGVVVGDLCRSSASTANWEIESFMDLAFTKTVAPPHRFGGAVRGL